MTQQTAKIALLRVASRIGLFRWVLNTKWRQQQLAILCYHGVSTDDEHLCFPGYFMDARTFEGRLELLRRLKINVVPLAEGLARLEAGTLPRRSAVLTIDDGFYGAYAVGRPILRRYGYPATVYMTTYYVYFNAPVFDPMVSYLLWKASGTLLDWPEVLDHPVLLDEAGRSRAGARIFRHASHRQLSGNDKNRLLSELAGRLDIDYEDLCRRRLLHLVNAEEIREWVKDADFQLHSHRHRLSRNKEVFQKQLHDNQQLLEPLVGKKCGHFCYPGGAFLPEFAGWLHEFGMESAVTCQGGLASRTSDRMLLPRIMDTATLDQEQLESWVTGARLWMPGWRKHGGRKNPTQILEDEVAVYDSLANRSEAP